MTTERHPDIEVYVKNSSPKALFIWLDGVCESIRMISSQPGNYKLECVFKNGASVPVMIEDNVAGKSWLSIWFNSDRTPWAIDLDCAREISRALQVQTRCVIGGWQEGDDPDEWWRVTADSAEKIIWKTE